MCSFKLLRSIDDHTASWSGGSTTELAIYPEDANYDKRNFSWRISTATVEVETSVFTPLAGFQRLTMVLSGEMTLVHEDHYEIQLKPYDQDRYNGNWLTRSTGMAHNFNLILAEHCTGDLMAIHIPEGMAYPNQFESEQSDITELAAAFYCVEGTVSVQLNDTNMVELNAGNLLLLKEFAPCPILIVNQGTAKSVLIKSIMKTHKKNTSPAC